MVPSNDWSFRWDSRETKLDPITRFNAAQLNKLRWTRSDLGNSIGNKWLVDLSDNRAWQDTSFAEKLCDVQKRAENESEYEALLRGAFGDQVAALWQTASPREEEAWTDTRLRAFQNAVETRAAWLYERLYKEIGLNEWQVESAERGEN